MKNLHIAGSKDTPAVDFNAAAGKLTLCGSCYPENVDHFFKPINAWLHDYFAEKPNAVELHLDFNYLNTSSIRHLMELLNGLRHFHNQNGNIKVYWHCDPDDEDTIVLADKIAHFSGLPVQKIERSV